MEDIWWKRNERAITENLYEDDLMNFQKLKPENVTKAVRYNNLSLWRRHIWYVNTKKSLVEWIIVHRNRN